MSTQNKNLNFDSVDLDRIDTDKLNAEEYIRLLKLKGIAGKGNYTEERRKWQDTITDEEMDEIDRKAIDQALKE